MIYQIYPRSYQDSNGDGIGDLKGIIRRLPYIAALGADAIWISPFFTSPMKDFGYDVSDYCDVDPMFGTLADFDALIAEAHRLGLKVMIDQVISHTSDQHPWFKESRSSRTNAKADWYVWADPKPDGTPPNNWLSIFGGSAWQWDTRRACNITCTTSWPSSRTSTSTIAEVQDALLDVDPLLAGARRRRLPPRHDQLLLPLARACEDNPALPPEASATTRPRRRSIPTTSRTISTTRAGRKTSTSCERFRALLDEYPAAAAVGEVGDCAARAEVVADYTAGGDRVQMCYAFDFLAPDKISAGKVREGAGGLRPRRQRWLGLLGLLQPRRDAPRHAAGARARPTATAYLKVISALLMSLRGSVCIYQGEELGLTEADLAFEDLQDPYGIRFWPEFKGRDGCRTPMVWECDAAEWRLLAGKAWLPVPAEHLALAVDAQQGDAASLLEHYRRFLAFRRDHPAFAKGDIEFLAAEATRSPSRAASATRRSSAPSTSALGPATIDLGGSRSVQALDGHGFSGNARRRQDPPRQHTEPGSGGCA